MHKSKSAIPARHFDWRQWYVGFNGNWTYNH